MSQIKVKDEPLDAGYGDLVPASQIIQDESNNFDADTEINSIFSTTTEADLSTPGENNQKSCSPLPIVKKEPVVKDEPIECGFESNELPQELPPDFFDILAEMNFDEQEDDTENHPQQNDNNEIITQEMQNEIQKLEKHIETKKKLKSIAQKSSELIKTETKEPPPPKIKSVVIQSSSTSSISSSSQYVSECEANNSYKTSKIKQEYDDTNYKKYRKDDDKYKNDKKRHRKRDSDDDKHRSRKRHRDDEKYKKRHRSRSRSRSSESHSRYKDKKRTRYSRSDKKRRSRSSSSSRSYSKSTSRSKSPVNRSRSYRSRRSRSYLSRSRDRSHKKTPSPRTRSSSNKTSFLEEIKQKLAEVGKPLEKDEIRSAENELEKMRNKKLTKSPNIRELTIDELRKKLGGPKTSNIIPLPKIKYESPSDNKESSLETAFSLPLPLVDDKRFLERAPVLSGIPMPFEDIKLKPIDMEICNDSELEIAVEGKQDKEIEKIPLPKIIKIEKPSLTSTIQPQLIKSFEPISKPVETLIQQVKIKEEKKTETTAEKRAKVLEMCGKAIKYLHRYENQKTAQFIYTPTVINECCSQKISEHRSPLNRINNVEYVFSAMSVNNVDLANYGLKSLPKNTTKLAKIIGISANEVYEKLNPKKELLRSLKLLRNQSSITSTCTSTNDDTSDTSDIKPNKYKAFYTSVATQTETFFTCTTCNERQSCKYKDVGIQIKPTVQDFSCHVYTYQGDQMQNLSMQQQQYYYQPYNPSGMMNQYSMHSYNPMYYQSQQSMNPAFGPITSQQMGTNPMTPQIPPPKSQVPLPVPPPPPPMFRQMPSHPGPRKLPTIAKKNL